MKEKVNELELLKNEIIASAINISDSIQEHTEAIGNEKPHTRTKIKED